MAQCAGITIGANYDCDNPPQAGVRQRLLLGNLSEIASTTFNVTNTYILETIVMATGKQMFAFEGVNNSLLPSYEFVQQTAGIGWNHIVDFSVFEVSSAQKQNIEAMLSVGQFALVENSLDSGNGDNAFEMYGLGRGLFPESASRAPADSDTGGLFRINIQTGTGRGGAEGKTPATFFNTDLATTQAAIVVLLAPAA